ncbi:MAG: hypothetical protein ACE5OY_07515 [Candidatus Bathyarchaeia archaeon]
MKRKLLIVGISMAILATALTLNYAYAIRYGDRRGWNGMRTGTTGNDGHGFGMMHGGMMGYGGRWATDGNWNPSYDYSYRGCPMAGAGMMGPGGYGMGSMMGSWLYEAEPAEVEGAVVKVRWASIELDADGESVEVYGPPWFWHLIDVEAGDTLTVKGVLVNTLNWFEERWHGELIPYEITINGKTYGDANLGIPIWMQRGA